MTADDQYSLLNRDNLTQPIQKQLSQKQKAFSELFSFANQSNFDHIAVIILKVISKDFLTGNIFPKLRTPKDVVRYLSKKSRFKGTFDRQHGKRVQTLLRSQSQYRYHI